MKFPEQYRVKKGAYGSSADENGYFIIPYERKQNGLLDKSILLIIASADLGWEHCSVSVRPLNPKIKKPTRLPRWDEMNFIKDLFWNEDETVLQLHPPKSEYVNDFEVLHLWKPVGVEIPLPMKMMV